MPGAAGPQTHKRGGEEVPKPVTIWKGSGVLALMCQGSGSHGSWDRARSQEPRPARGVGGEQGRRALTP